MQPNLIRVSTVDYLTFVRVTYEGAQEYLNRYWQYRHNYSIPGSFFDDVLRYSKVKWINVLCVVALALCFTLSRIWLTRRVVLPLCEYLRLPLSVRDKVPESVWKLIFYSIAWLWSCYVVLISGRYNYFHDPMSCWENFRSDMEVPEIPWDITIGYLIQSSFYLHSIYGTIYMDIWRKDSIVMLVHHFLTLMLIGFSFAFRCHAVGALVLLLHDISDVALEFTKINVYLKYRGGQYRPINDALSTVGFGIFALSWFVFRLYWFPLKVLYVTLYGAAHMLPVSIPFIPMFNVMLWILLGMNTYWFHFILLCLYKVFTGQMINDTREFELFKADQQRLLDQNGVCAPAGVTEHNGHIKTGQNNPVQPPAVDRPKAE